MPGRPFKKGNPGGPGRPPKDPVQREIDKQIKLFAKQKAATFIEACEHLLPLGVDRVQEILKRKGAKHATNHIRVLDLLADRAFGRPPMAITGAGGGPIAMSFEALLKDVDGAKNEKFK